MAHFCSACSYVLEILKLDHVTLCNTKKSKQKTQQSSEQTPAAKLLQTTRHQAPARGLGIFGPLPA